MTSACHYLLPAEVPVFALYLAAAVGCYLWGRLYWTAVLAPDRRPPLGGVGLRVLAGFAALTIAAQALQRHLVFATSWPLWPILLAGAGLVELIVILYQREQAHLQPRRVRRLLTATRVLLVLALIFILVQPGCSWEQRRTVRRQVAILLDTSASMCVPDNQATPAEQVRLAHLLGLTNIPPPSAFIEHAIRLKELGQRLNAQADGLATLAGGVEGDTLKNLRKQRRDLDRTLDAAQEEITRQTNGLASVWAAQGSALQATLRQHAGQFTTNAQARLNDLRQRLAAALADRGATNLAARSGLLARDFRAAAAALAAMEPKLVALADQLDDALYAALADPERAAVEALAARKRVELAGQLLGRPTRLRGKDPEILLERLGKDYGLRLYTFGAKAEETDAQHLPSLVAAAVNRPITNAAGLSTDLAAALEQAAVDTPAEQLAGILVLTDGNHNAAKPIEPILRTLGLHALPVSTVVFGGNRQPPADAAIAALEAPAAVSTNDRVNLVAHLKLDGVSQTSLTVNLYRDDALISSQSVTAASAAFRSRIPLGDVPRSNGLTTYRVTVQAVSNDVIPENNRMAAPVYVAAEQTRVLMADGWPRWEFRYLKNLFSARDNAVRFQYILFHPDQVDQAPPRAAQPASAGRSADDSEATAWPASPADWMAFDVIILGDIERDLLSDAELGILKDFVLTRGGTLVVIAGPMSMPGAFTQAALAELLPVTVPPPNPALPSGGPEEEYRLVLTSEGRDSPLLRLALDPEQNVALWNTMPDLFWRHAIQGLKPGATVLAYALPLLAPEFMRRPVPTAEELERRRQFEKDHALIVTQPAGAGRVLFMAFDETWRFRYREGDLWHHKFWGQVQRWATADKLPFGSGGLRMGTDQWVYAPGAPVRVRVRAVQADFSPVAGLNIAVRCVRRGTGSSSDKPLRKTLSPEPGVPGSYAATLGAFPEGRYELTLDPRSSRALSSLAGEPVTGEFAVQAGASAELINLAADRGLLQRMADLTGGGVADPPRTRDVLDTLAAPTLERIERRHHNLWTSWMVWSIIVGLGTLEWATRKRKGLP